MIQSKETYIDRKSQPIQDILERVIASGFIKNAQPLSCLLIAPVGAGKTTSLQKYSINKNILALSDVTPYGFTKMLNEIKMNKVKHIIIYDLVEPMSRSRNVVNNLIGFLNSLIEEGLFRISTAYIELKEPIKLGLITCTTGKELEDKRRGWLGIGFISRLLPISFNYSSTDIIQIMEDLASQKIRTINYKKLSILEKEIKGNERIFKMLIPYAEGITYDGAMPFRQLEQLKTLLMANALLRKDKEVREIDFEWFKSIVKFINYKMDNL